MKGFWNKIWDEFVYGGQLHSIGLALLIYASTVLLGKGANIYFLIIVYLSLHSVYLFNRYHEAEIDVHDNPERSQHLQGYVKFMPYVILFFLMLSGLLLYFFGNIVALFIGAIMLLIGLSYTLSLKKFTQKIIGFKNYFIALSFASLLVLYVFFSKLQPNGSTVSVFVALFVLIFIRAFLNTVFFDIKDVKTDSEHHLKTFPVLLGVSKTIFFIRIINILSGIWIIISIACFHLPTYALVLLFVLPFTEFYIWKSKKGTFKVGYISALYVDGEYLLWFVLLILGYYLHGNI